MGELEIGPQKDHIKGNQEPIDKTDAFY